MDYAESSAAAETELREAILLEFIKPELPATIVLLRYSERYVTKIFDARAAQKLEKMPRDEYDSYLRGMVKSLPVSFFGCAYSTIPVVVNWPHLLSGLDSSASPARSRISTIPAVVNWPHLGSPWGRCIEYALLARIDHSDLPGTDDEILKRYSV